MYPKKLDVSKSILLKKYWKHPKNNWMYPKQLDISKILDTSKKATVCPINFGYIQKYWIYQKTNSK